MDEKRKIIEMVSEGKISAEEAERLIVAMTPKKIYSKSKKIVFIIQQEETGKTKLKFSIPLKFAKLGINLIPKSSTLKANINSSNFDISSIDWNEILDMATSGEEGDLFYMETEEENGSPLIIRIYVE